MKLSYHYRTALFIILMYIIPPLHGYVYFNNGHEALQMALRYLPTDPIILEAGAYDGSDSLYMAHVFPGATIHSFEPVPNIYKKLVQNTRHTPIIKTYRTALSNKVGTAEMYISDRSNPHDNHNVCTASSSLLKPKAHLTYAPHVRFTHTIEVPVTTIDAWAHQHNITRIDFMWLDMQGSELDALKAASTILPTVRVIFTEISGVEAYKNQCLFSELRLWLEERGFTLFATCHFDPLNPPCWSDALFVRLP